MSKLCNASGVVTQVELVQPPLYSATLLLNVTEVTCLL